VQAYRTNGLAAARCGGAVRRRSEMDIGLHEAETVLCLLPIVNDEINCVVIVLRVACRMNAERAPVFTRPFC